MVGSVFFSVDPDGGSREREVFHGYCDRVFVFFLFVPFGHFGGVLKVADAEVERVYEVAVDPAGPYRLVGVVGAVVRVPLESTR